MVKIKNLLMKYFGSFPLVAIVCNNDLLIIIILIILSLKIFRSNNILDKLFKKNKDEDNKNKEDKCIIKKSNDLEKEHDIKKDNDTKKENDTKKDDDNKILNDVKNNIKLIYKKKDDQDNKSMEPYKNDKPDLQKKYEDKTVDHKFIVNVNSTICSTPIFNLRTYKELDFHYNFLIHDFCPKKINNLIMCKDIHQWMTSSSLSSEDLSDELVPVYFIKKQNNITDVYEYLKLFIHTDKNGIKIAFVQKGVDFLIIKNDINKLISKDLIKDLLLDKHYHNYNLSAHDGVSDFLNNFLSLVLIPEHCIGEKINIDIKNYYENQKAYEYFFNTVNSDVGVFNTTI